MTEQSCANCKYSEPRCGALCCMGQKYAPYVRPTDSCADWKPAKQTNGDRIRSMTDEELAEFISGKARTFGEEYEGYMSALDWLKEEVTTNSKT